MQCFSRQQTITLQASHPLLELLNWTRSIGSNYRPKGAAGMDCCEVRHEDEHSSGLSGFGGRVGQLGGIPAANAA